jgi:hypothetical protein
LVSVLLLLAVYLLTSASLWLLPVPVQDDPAWFGPIICLGLWLAGFFGGILQLYNLTERGMALRMLIDVRAGHYRAWCCPDESSTDGGSTSAAEAT